MDANAREWWERAKPFATISVNSRSFAVQASE